MSVMVTARLHKSKEEIERATRHNPTLQSEVLVAARASGCLDHRVVAAGDEAMMVEEWEDTSVFEVFFDSTPSYRHVIAEAGFNGVPDDIKLWREVGPA